MFLQLGRWVSGFWWAVILFWMALVFGLALIAPDWDDVTMDGDFAYLPGGMPSVVGEQLTQEAFHANRARSKIVLVAAREDGTLGPDDFRIANKLAVPFQNMLGVVELTRGRQMIAEAEALLKAGKAQASGALSDEANAVFKRAEAVLDASLEIDDQYAPALHNRSLVARELGSFDQAVEDRKAADQLDPSLAELGKQPVPGDVAQLPLVDVWTTRTDVFGQQLDSLDGQARLIVLRLSSEFMATENIRVMNLVEGIVDGMRARIAEDGPAGLDIGITGSAAVGGDMLRSIVQSIRNTENLTVWLVIVILLLVYRAPLLLTVPLATIAVALSVSTDLLALLTQVNQLPGMDWWGFQLYKTTRIFIVVILFGAGTDFCLFLIARYREELDAGLSYADAITHALGGVGHALLGSALTTIIGLGTMYFAEFGKFRSSGPAIGLCLLVTLLACLTLAPALLRLFGSSVFWPFGHRMGHPDNRLGAGDRVHRDARERSRSSGHVPRGITAPVWNWLAHRIVAHPERILVVSVVLLAPLALVGMFRADHVTYDFLSELAPDQESVQGNQLLRRHFPVGEAGPLVILANAPKARFDAEDAKVRSKGMDGVFELTVELSEIDGVSKVRSLSEPLGEPPEPISILATRKLAIRESPLTKAIYLAQSPEYRGSLTRLELILDDDAFSPAAIETYRRVSERMRELSQDPTSFWYGATMAYTGTTAGISDLRAVMQVDNWRIRVLVVLAVFGVLVVLLRRPLICLYLIASVLFSYLVTIGASGLFFAWLYGETFQGLDYKVPIFLFVILVAVGEDYNIYLVTRVLEEQQQRGPFAGLRAAIVSTGGIITSCGVIMAGTFLSMTAGTLRGMIELGFALALGILLDTMVVRPVLVPAFLSILCRWQARREIRQHTAVGKEA